jgi:adenine-specific DNA-methyltransferase
MNASNKKIRNRHKLQSLLRELFQFDSADLDFGIYRIMNQKRDEIERFIECDLLDAVEEGLAGFRSAERDDLEAQLKQKREDIGPEGFDEQGEVREDIRGLTVVKEYESLKGELRGLELAEETETRVLNDLYTFFSRYYDNGDFLTERRWSSKEPKFAVPYNGEEVLLHWANRDQYYVKTSEHFTDYRFTTGDYTILFRLERAQVAQDNAKGDKRYFVLRARTPVDLDDETKNLTIFFEYRPVSDEEEASLLGIYNARQGKDERRKSLDRSVLCVALETEILHSLDEPDLKAHLAIVPEGRRSSILYQHLSRYTARNTMDYFVHKDLGGFLRRELQSYLKTQVLCLDDVISDKATQLSAHVIARGRVVEQVAERIITFLAQIEDFQKRLFEKRKFVVQTDYCMTLDRVPEEFYPEIVENKAQQDEWRRLYGIDAWDENLLWTGEFDREFLRNHPYLMLDTTLFGDDFKARLLGTFDDLDGATDGVLIHAENFQALNLLVEKYRAQVKCAYIDPPYNTGSDEFVYKDNYRHSSWLAMMRDRLQIARETLREQGAIFISCDDNEQPRLASLSTELFGEGNELATIIWEKVHTRKNSAKYFSVSHDYIMGLAREKQAWDRVLLPREDDSGYSNPDNDPKGPWKPDPVYANNPYDADYVIEKPNGVELGPPPGQYWRYSKETFNERVGHGEVIWGEGNSYPMVKRYLSDVQEGLVPVTLFTREFAGDNSRANGELDSLFGASRLIPYPKPSLLIKRLCQITTRPHERALVLDFFAGSGTTAHAVMDLNREDGGNRGYILAEMAGYFDTLLKPRVQKVAFCSKWNNGVPQNHDGVSHMFKYQRLESYEDSLNNIRLSKLDAGERELLYEETDDYMLSYMLELESRDSPSLLSPDAFDKPFQYTLKIQGDDSGPRDTIVDLVETFHYLIGLTVHKLEQHEHQGRRYVVSRGDLRTEQGIEIVVTIWRDTEGLDLEEEAQWANAELLPDATDRVYVNGPSFIDKAEPLEITFRQLMEAPIIGV